MVSSDESSELEVEIFKGKSYSNRTVQDSSDYSDDPVEVSEEEESDDSEVYGSKKKSVNKKKRAVYSDSEVSEDSEDSDEDWGSKKNSKSSKKKKSKKNTKKKNKKANTSGNARNNKAKVTNGIVSDESDDEDSDEEFRTKKKTVSSGEIEFRQDWSDPALRIVDSIGDWNEEKDEFLVKWKGRSWNWAVWLPSNAPELYVARRKLENFIKKIEEERQDNEEMVSVTLETLRFNLLENWKNVERVIAVKETSGQGNFYLCKWRALGYAESTWEWEGDIRGFSEGASEKVDEFLARQYGKRSNAAGSRSFKRYKEQPEYFSKDLALRDYQLDGLNWLLYSWCRRVNVILADEMGLGKTIQSVCFLTSLKVDYGTSGPTLLVVPLSTIDAWQREFGLWAGDRLNVIVYTGDAESRATVRKYEFPGGFDVLLTTYELVLKDHALLESVKWRLLLVDEGHRLKNSSSQLYDVLFKLVPSSGRVLITGTPLQNSLGELWCLLRFLMPEKFSDYEDFLQKYSVDLGSEGGSNVRLEELHALIKPHILRRLKRDVEHSLKGKTEKIVRVDLTPLQKQLYRYILTRNYRDLKRTQEAAGNRAVGGLLNILGELKKICNHPLLLGKGSPALQEFTQSGDNFGFKLEESGKLVILQRLLRRLKDEGHRVLIFSQSVRMLDLLQSFVKSEGYAWQRLDGSTTSVARHLAIQAYNAPGSNDFVFLLSTRAGGLGINLATADTVIIYDSDWNPQNDLQAMARAHRIGQKKLVRIFRLVSAGTVEEEILERAKRKMVLDHLVIQQLKKGSGTSSDLQAILKFGAKSLFDAETPAIPASAVDLDAIFAETEVADDPAEPDRNADNQEFLGQFRMADLGAVPNWDEIIPEAERIKAEENEKNAEELAKEVELQEALFTAASTRRSRIKSIDKSEVKPVESDAVVLKREKVIPDDNALVLFPEGDDTSISAYESASRFGIVENENWYKKLTGRIEEIIEAALSENPSALPCHFRVIPGSPLQKASLPGLLERLKGLKALQVSLKAYRDRVGNGVDVEMSGFRHSILGIKPPSSWPITPYSVQHDSALLVALGKFGYGSWQSIRRELGEKNANGWMQLQAPQITRRVEYLLKELVNKSVRFEKVRGRSSPDTKDRTINLPKHSAPPATDETRIIEKFRRPFKPVRSSLLALESLKSSQSTSENSLGSLLADNLSVLGDFIESNEELRNDREAWEFIGCFWPYQKGCTGPELKILYKALKLK